jgi:rhodanese-related sulfurtransferase
MKIGYKALIENAEKEIETLDQAAAAKLLNHADVVFVDLRDPRELTREGKIPGAFHAPAACWSSGSIQIVRITRTSSRPASAWCSTARAAGGSALATQTVQHMA